MSSNDKKVELETTDDVSILRLNNPDKMNAVDHGMVDRMIEMVVAEADTDERALMITGNGDATCAGRDVELVSQPEWQGSSTNSRELMSALGSYPLPTALAGKGAVVGFGFAVAMACDFVVMGSDTHFSYPEIEWNINTPGKVAKLEEYVSPRVAKEILLLGEAVDPHRAHNLGLVNEVVDEEAVDETTLALLERVMEMDEAIVRDYVLESRLRKQT